ncbi:MAG: iron ABC transporter [Desulfobacterales bacterium RIFOXYA12_FULL_46_15]|nr:MAG: iron ABC transporter [Desulfobacterales bacterium RIFOXYA12_FULL_46_15]
MEIRLHNVSFSYDAGMTIKAFSGSFSSGSFYSVIGPNGSGKTTLIDLISGFLKPLSGNIEINSLPVFSFSKKNLARLIAVVSQDHTVNFPFSVKDIILMGRHPYISRFSLPSAEDIQKVEKLMDICGISHLQDRKINELSGGERQRCVFARALCQETPILLLDEAFSNMDIHHTLQMLQLVKQSVKEKNRIVISVFHDLNLASTWSDSLLVLKEGELRAFGSSTETLTEEIIKDVFQVDSIVEYNQHVHAKQVYYPMH